MKRIIPLAGVLALSGGLAAAMAALAQENTLDEVKVAAELGDVNAANALEFWPTITQDLAAAIKAKAGPLVSEDGYDLTVSLKEVSLSGSKLLTGGGEFNRLEGWVYFRPDGNPVPEDQHDIIINAVTAPVPDGTFAVIVPDKPEFYAAMLDGFAAATIERLQALDGSPSASDDNRPSN